MARVLGLTLVFALLSTACPSREEVLQKAEDQGKLLAEKKARLAKGVGEGLQNEGKQAGESVMKGAAGVVKGMIAGAETGFSELPLQAEGLPELGLKAERASLHALREGGTSTSGVKVYLVNERPFTGKLTLLARDAQARELGRSTVEVAEAAPTGRHVFFPFEALADLTQAEAVELSGTPAAP